jgi:hypothetical protein
MSNTSYRDFLTNTLNLSPKDKVLIARGALKTIIEYSQKIGASKEDINTLIANFTKLFVSSDVTLVGDEYSFFKAVVGSEISPKDFSEMTDYGSDPEFVEASLEFIGQLPLEVREAVLTYGMMVMACDENINYQESDLIKRILALF